MQLLIFLFILLFSLKFYDWFLALANFTAFLLLTIKKTKIVFFIFLNGIFPNFDF